MLFSIKKQMKSFSLLRITHRNFEIHVMKLMLFYSALVVMSSLEQ